MTVDKNNETSKRRLRPVNNLTVGLLVLVLAVAAGIAAARSTAWAAGIGAGAAVLAVLLTIVNIWRRRH